MNKKLSTENSSSLVPRSSFLALQRGDISLFMALVIMLVLTSSAIVFSSILSKQIRLSEDIAASERAFYAANTGLEQALNTLANTDDFTFSVSETISYPDNTKATYEVEAEAIEIPGTGKREACVLSTGRYRNETRRIFTGPEDCELN